MLMVVADGNASILLYVAFSRVMWFVVDVVVVVAAAVVGGVISGKRNLERERVLMMPT